MDAHRTWLAWAIEQVEADANRSADTHLLLFPLPVDWGVSLYLKDESVHPTGSLKHRLARSLVLYGLCNDWIGAGTTLVEASSGSTAVSEAYFAQLLGLPFIAVMPATTVREKCELIEFYGGTCHLVEDPSSIYAVAAQLADDCGGHFLDQFTYAERATDWRGNNNIAESMFAQLGREPSPPGRRWPTRWRRPSPRGRRRTAGCRTSAAADSARWWRWCPRSLRRRPPTPARGAAPGRVGRRPTRRCCCCRASRWPARRR